MSNTVLASGGSGYVAGWAQAMAGCSHVAHVVHVASPLPAGVPKDANELIVPARDGALRALRAAKAAGVKRCVMASSVVAISQGRGRGVHHFTEADWTDASRPGISACIQSKTIDDVLRARLGDQASQVTTHNVPDGLVRTVARFSPLATAAPLRRHGGLGRPADRRRPARHRAALAALPLRCGSVPPVQR